MTIASSEWRVLENAQVWLVYFSILYHNVLMLENTQVWLIITCDVFLLTFRICCYELLEFMECVLACYMVMLYFIFGVLCLFTPGPPLGKLFGPWRNFSIFMVNRGYGRLHFILFRIINYNAYANAFVHNNFELYLHIELENLWCIDIGNAETKESLCSYSADARSWNNYSFGFPWSWKIGFAWSTFWFSWHLDLR